MRIALKFTLCLMIMISLVVGLEIVFHVKGEQRLMEEDLRERHKEVGSFFSARVEDSWRTGGRHAAHELVKTQNQSGLAAHWKLVSDAESAHSALLDANPSWGEQLKKGQNVLWKHAAYEHSSTAQRVSYWVLETGGEGLWFIECVEPLETLEKRLAQEFERALILAVIVLLLSLLLSLAVGYVLVGRRVGHLLERFEHIKQGDWTSRPVDFTPGDELAELGVAFEEMVAHVNTTREALQHEQHARQHVTEQLRQADRLRSVGALAAGVAHELGSPLHVIEGRATMLLTGSQDTARIERNARIIVEQSERVQRIVRRLMDLSRREVQAYQRLSFNELAQDVVELLEARARDQGITLVCTHINSAVVFHGERVLLEQALINLIENSIAASSNESQIEVGAVRAESSDEVGLYVQDHGLGMSESQRLSATDPFYTTKEVGQGTGLGLSITHGIVDEHDGRMEIESGVEVESHGTRITLWFPSRTTPLEA